MPESADDCVNGALTTKDHFNVQKNNLRQYVWGLYDGKHHYGNYIVDAESSEFKLSCCLMVDIVGICDIVDFLDESDPMIL